MPYVLLAISVGWAARRCAVALHDTDAWWHLALGEHFLETGSFSAPDGWSTFATSTWVPTQPLSELAAVVVEHTFGLPGLVWLFVASVCFLVLAMFMLCRQSASPLPASVATLFFIATAQNAFTARPQMLSYIFLVFVLAAWLRTDRDLKPRWWLIPLTWVWSLSHGFWFIGIGYGCLFVVSLLLTRRTRPRQAAQLIAIPVLSSLAVLINPAGYAVYLAPFAVSERGHYILEWQRTDLLTGQGLLSLLIVFATFVIWMVRRRDVSTCHMLLLVSALVWDWYAVRTVTLGAIVVAPLFASALESLLSRAEGSKQPDRREYLGILGGAVALLAIVAVVVPRTAERPGGVPLQLDPLLDEMPAGSTVFNEYLLGGWLAWRHPELNRYVDGLADAYPASHLREYAEIVGLEPGWQARVARVDPTAAVLLETSDLARALQTEGWTVRAVDEGWVLLVPPTS
jgi:hypothetical protein